MKKFLFLVLLTIASSTLCKDQIYFKDSAKQFIELRDSFSVEKLSSALKELSADFSITLSSIDNATSLTDSKTITKKALNDMKYLGEAISKLS